MLRVRCCLVGFLLLLVGCRSSARPWVLATAEGPIAGMEVRGLRVFLDVPYAAAPLGPRRWRETEPLPPRAITLAADRRLPGRDPEDCLRFDLWLPAPLSRPAPLLVWFDTAVRRRDPAPDGSRLATTGIAVAVVRTRRGLLGTFAHPALERQRPAGPIDFTAGDRLAALHWFAANAPHLGIDASQVTIGGAHEEASALLPLLRDPASRPLFARAVLHAPRKAPAAATRASAIAAGERLLAEHGLLPATTASDLRALPAIRLLAIAATGTDLARPTAAAVSAPVAAMPHGVALLIGTDGVPADATAVQLALAAAPMPSFLFSYTFTAADAESPARSVTTALFAPLEPGLGGDRWLDDRRVCEIVRDYWTGFVRTGRPECPTAPPWPAFEPAQRGWQQLALPVQTQR